MLTSSRSGSPGWRKSRIDEHHVRKQHHSKPNPSRWCWHWLFLGLALLRGIVPALPGSRQGVETGAAGPGAGCRSHGFRGSTISGLSKTRPESISPARSETTRPTVVALVSIRHGHSIAAFSSKQPKAGRACHFYRLRVKVDRRGSAHISGATTSHMEEIGTFRKRQASHSCSKLMRLLPTSIFGFAES